MAKSSIEMNQLSERLDELSNDVKTINCIQFKVNKKLDQLIEGIERIEKLLKSKETDEEGI